MKTLWFGNVGHFICGHLCRFHMTTQVGKYLVSTVGEMWPDRGSREIHARLHDAEWHAANNHLKGDEYDAAYMKRFDYQEIGYNRKYETMVFKAGASCTSKTCGCGLPMIDGGELDALTYNDAKAATEGHMKLVQKWTREQQRPKKRGATKLRRSVSKSFEGKR
jgi:hypothetical protein